MKKEIVHSSTNSHYVLNAENVTPEQSYTVSPEKVAELVHEEHDALFVLPSQCVEIGFVNTMDYATKIIERIRD